MVEQKKLVEAKSFVTPKKVLFGVGVVEKLAIEAAGLGAKQALLVCTPSAVRNGIAKKLEISLSKEGIRACLFDQIGPDPTAAVVDQCTEVARNNLCDLIVGVGGGSALDVAKGAAIAAPGQGKFNDLLGRDLTLIKVLPKILVPTTSGSGSEVSQAVVFVDKQTGSKFGLHNQCLIADAAIVDPQLVLSLPPSPTADGGLDAFIHAVEAILATKATPMSDAVAFEASHLIWGNLKAAFQQGTDIYARQQVALASMMAGMAFTWAGLGAIHALAYPLNIDCGLSHGRSNAVVCPYVLSFNAASCPQKILQLVTALDLDVEEREPGEVLAEAVGEFINQLGISTRLRDYGVSKTDLPDMAERAVSSGERLLATNPRPVTVDNALKIYQQAW
ncbi:MAG: iron-containing alcohol dehydrogenase [Bacillota bacterium]|nr:iron-containing alcohol dehydrogenase [Bacillota bacterium]